MSKITVMIAGLSAREGQGKMARLMVDAIQDQPDMRLYPFGMAEERGDLCVDSGPGPAINVRLIPTANHEELLGTSRGMVHIIVDFTQPTAVNRNAHLYCEAGIPFVMGTTGGDRNRLIGVVNQSGISAVIETNFSPWVNVFREMFRFAGKNFPGAFKGGKRLLKEGHQPTKKDPSGTMISMFPALEALFGEPLDPSEIRMVRDALVQELEYGVLAKDTTGCGYHSYRFRSPNGAVDLNFEHNIRGRLDYVDGCLQAIRFLAERREEKGKVFSMVDVLKG